MSPRKHQARTPPPPAWVTLARAVRRMWDETDYGPPCSAEPRRWIEPKRDDLPNLRAICRRCPLNALCREAAPHAVAGVWGGILRPTDRPPRKQPTGRTPDQPHHQEEQR